MAHPGTEMYGSDRVLLDSASALRDRGWTVTVALPERGALTEALEERGIDVRVCPAPVLRKSALRPAGFVRLLRDAFRSIGPQTRLLRELQPDIVYVSTVTIPGWTAVARARGFGVACHVHEAETGAPMIVKRLMALPLLLTRSILINSEFSRRVLLESLSRLGSRSEVIPNPVDGPPSVVPARAALDGPVRILFIGRLSPRKGPDVAVRALDLLRRRGVDARLDLLGAVFPGYEWFEADLHAEVERMALRPFVDFLGFRPDVWPTIEGADLVVVPSVVDEPFGNTAVEAILAARPVVASTSGGLVEAISGYASAFSVAPNDADGLAEAVATIVEEWDTTRAAAIEDSALAAERHSPNRYGERLDAALGAALR